MAGAQVVHAGREIGLGRLKEQVQMVVHHHPTAERILIYHAATSSRPLEQVLEDLFATEE